MNDIIQELKADVTNGVENFCYISEKRLLILKELSKRETQEHDIYKQALIDIRDFLKKKDEEYLFIEGLDRILQIIHEVIGDDER